MCRTQLLLVMGIALWLTPACKKSDGRVPVYPVQGKVIVNGAPADGARVVFYPISDELRKPGMPVPEGITDSLGVFKLKSYVAGDGAPEGEFKVGVVWLEPMPPNADPDVFERRDRLGDKYADPGRSKLTAT